MPFTDSIKQEARRKSGYACCICHTASISLEVHHIVPQEDGGSDDIDNAAPMCPTCHADFGGNRDKISRVREMKDWWFEQVTNMYQPRESALIRQISDDLSNIKETLPNFKEALGEFMRLRIEQITPDTAQMAVSRMVGGTTSAVSFLMSENCQNCGEKIINHVIDAGGRPICP